MPVINIFEPGEAIGVIFQLINFDFEMIGEIRIDLKGFGRKRVAAQVGEMIFGESKNLVERFFIAFGFVNEDFAKFDEPPQISFFLDDIGVIFGTSGGISSVDKREQIGMVDFLEVAGFTKFFLDGKIVDRHAFGIEAEDSLENESVFDAEKVVRL